ncbi:acyltransferase family protein [Isoptericola jiangsuensis]|uniref:acyltransferase family protein n=1 Tax=Isoptericola jiangsuensis TaxID=548579 RepID=UPI003AAC8229
MATQTESGQGLQGRTPAAPATPGGARRTTDPHRRRRASGSRERVVGLDALRALAVLLVIAYHVSPTTLPGGFLGVDVFFVVSGFIITTLLVREIQGSRRIRLAEFWRRRARRLLPALAVVVVVSVVAARIVSPDLLVGIGRQVLGAATFSSNWLEISAGTSYFDETAPQLFQTFWSLAVEEQFYLLWPVVLVLLIVLTPAGRAREVVVAAGALASAVAMAVMYVPGGDPTRVYYGTDTHCFGLLLGAAAALRWSTGGRLLPERAWWAVPVGLGGLAALVAGLHADSAWAYRGGILLGSVLALLLVARCADVTEVGRRTFGVRLAECRPVVWVGARSYGLYLWHWPVLLLVDAAVGAQPGTPQWWRGVALATGITLLASPASYRWVETPVRRDGFRATVRRVAGALGAFAPRPVAARVLAGTAALVVLVAGVAVATAPQVSQAQLAVERGQALLAQQAESGAVSEPVSNEGDDGADDAAPVQDEDDADGADQGDEAVEEDGAKEADEPADDAASDETDEAAAEPAQEKITGDRISAFGDSVLSGAAPALLDRFPGIDVDGLPIRKWVDAPEIVRAAERDGDLREVVVLQFGTNGGFAWNGAVEALEEIIDLAGPDRTVVVVSTVGVSSWVPETNKTLDKIAAKHDNVYVAPWADAVRDRPGLLYDDRTHPNVEGIEVYAKVLKKTLAQIG